MRFGRAGWPKKPDEEDEEDEDDGYRVCSRCGVPDGAYDSVERGACNCLD